MAQKRNISGDLTEPEAKKQKTGQYSCLDAVERGTALLKSGKWSDFTIKCQQHSFKVHRIVLSGQSEYFDRAIESTFKESAEQELDLSKEEPLIVATILWYIYTQRFRLRDMDAICLLVNEPTNPTTTNTYLLLVKIHQCANYLMLNELSKLVFRKLADLLRHAFYSSDRTRAERISYRPLLLKCVDYLFENDETVDKVKELFAWILTIVNDRRSKLYLLSDEHLDEILEEYPGLGAYMYRSMATQSRQEPKCYDCESLMMRERNERCLIVDFDGILKCVKCVCSWRGLCSSYCYSKESKISRGGARCLNCAKTLNLENADQKRNFCWEDDQIKLAQDEEAGSQIVNASTGDVTASVVIVD